MVKVDINDNSDTEGQKQELLLRQKELNQINEKIKGKREEKEEKEKQLAALEMIEKEVDSQKLQHLFQGGILLNKENISKYLSYPNERDEGPWIYDPKEKYLYKLDGTLLYCAKETHNETLEIPEGVTKIGKYAFFKSTYKKVQLPESVSYIEKSAFTDCKELEEITMPGVKTIETEAFSCCDKLKRIDCPNVRDIEKRAFLRCSKLREIFLPQCITIQEEAFDECPELEEIYLGDHLQEIDPNALPDKKIKIMSSKKTFEKVKEATGKNKLEYEEYTFDPIALTTPSKNEEFHTPQKKIDFKAQKATIQEKIKQLSNKIKDLDDEANKLRSTNTKSTQEIKKQILAQLLPTIIAQDSDGPLTEIINECTIIDKEIDKYSFKDPYLLKALDSGLLRFHEKTGCIYNNAGELIRYFGNDTSFKIPDGITKICDGAFKNSSIKEVIIPDSVKEIGESAFEGSNIEKLNFPEGIKKISASACKNCKNLERVNLPNTLEIIDNEAFRNCHKLRKLTIPNSVKEIGEYAFAFSNIEELNFPEGIKNISDNICRQCANLKTVHLPKTLETIGKSAFQACFNLQGIKLPDSLKSIGDQAFFATDIKYLAILPSVENIGEGILGHTTLRKLILPQRYKEEVRKEEKRHNRGYVKKENLICDDELAKFHSRLSPILSHDQPIKWTLEQDGTLTFDNNLQIILKKAFGEKETEKQKTRKIIIPDSVQFIQETTFEDRHELKEVKLSDSMWEIPDSLFYGCNKLRKITLPKNLIRIDKGAFFQCVNLKEIDIPKTVNFIGKSAFCLCTQLKDIKIPEATLGKNIFLECTNLKLIELPKKMFNPQGKIKKEYLENSDKDLSIEELKVYLGLGGKDDVTFKKYE